MYLSKAYDCLSHDLLIAKLEAYGLDAHSLNFLCLKFLFEICRGIPQGSILGLLLFNIFTIVEKSEICNFADENTTYSCGKDLPKIKEDLIYAVKTY